MRLCQILGTTIVIVSFLASCQQRSGSSKSQFSEDMLTHVLTTPQRHYEVAKWSPDGRFIAAIGWRVDLQDRIPESLLLLNAKGDLINEIVQFEDDDGETVINAISWRHDGLLAVVVSLLTSADLQQDPLPDRDALFLVDPMDGDRPPQLLRRNLAPITDMDWSPDGRYLLLQQQHGNPHPPAHVRDEALVLYDPAADTLRVWQTHDTYLKSPRWHPSGSSVMYVVGTVPGQQAPEDQEIVVQPWPNGPPQRISRVPACTLFDPTWSPSGDQILYREICNNVNGRRIDNLVVSTLAHPLDGVEVCGGDGFSRPDWGIQNQILAVTIEFRGNQIVVCTAPTPITGSSVHK